MANKITYANKVGLVPKDTHVNEVWDDDMNEIKEKHNLNDDRITSVEESVGSADLKTSFRLFTARDGYVELKGDSLVFTKLYIIDSESGKRVYLTDGTNSWDSENTITLTVNKSLYFDLSDFQSAANNTEVTLSLVSWYSSTAGAISIGMVMATTTETSEPWVYHTGLVFDLIRDRGSYGEIKSRLKLQPNGSGYAKVVDGDLIFSNIYLIDTGTGKRLYLHDGTNNWDAENTISIASKQMFYIDLSDFNTLAADSEIEIKQKSWVSSTRNAFPLGIHFSESDDSVQEGWIYDLVQKRTIKNLSSNVPILNRRSGNLLWSYNSTTKENSFEFDGVIYLNGKKGNALQLTGSPIAIGENQFAYVDVDEWANDGQLSTIAVQVAEFYPTGNAFDDKIVLASCSKDATKLSYIDGALADLARDIRGESEKSAVLNMESVRSNYKLSKIKNGEQSILNVMLYGDSITHVVTTFSKYAYFVAKALRDEYGSAGGGFFSFGQSNSTFMNSVDSDDATIVRSGTIDYSSAQTANAKGVDISDARLSSGASLFLNVVTDVTNLVLHYYQYSGGGEFRYRVDGGTWINIDSDGVNSHQTVDIAVSEAAHTLEIEAIDSGVILMGVDMQNNNVSGVRVHKMGCRGLTSQEAVSVDGDVWKDAVTALAPDIITINLGTNDTLAGYETYYKSLIERMEEAVEFADIVLIAANNTPTKNMTLYRERVFEIAANQEKPYIDLIPLFGFSADMAHYGSMYDGTHPTTSGGKLIAESMIKNIWNL